MVGQKIIDKINAVHAEGGITTSFEFFPAKTDTGIFNLLNRVEEMGHNLKPTFVTLTWRSAFKDADLWLRIGSHIQNNFQMDVLLHLTCHLPAVKLREIVHQVREAGIRNILVLRGDPPIGEASWTPVEGGYSNAVELIRAIRQDHGDYFCIACAGVSYISVNLMFDCHLSYLRSILKFTPSHGIILNSCLLRISSINSIWSDCEQSKMLVQILSLLNSSLMCSMYWIGKNAVEKMVGYRFRFYRDIYRFKTTTPLRNSRAGVKRPYPGEFSRTWNRSSEMMPR